MVKKKKMKLFQSFHVAMAFFFLGGGGGKGVKTNIELCTVKYEMSVYVIHNLKLEEILVTQFVDPLSTAII